jgi:hypothetical protein
MKLRRNLLQGKVELIHGFIERLNILLAWLLGGVSGKDHNLTSSGAGEDHCFQGLGCHCHKLAILYEKIIARSRQNSTEFSLECWGTRCGEPEPVAIGHSARPLQPFCAVPAGRKYVFDPAIGQAQAGHMVMDETGFSVKCALPGRAVGGRQLAVIRPPRCTCGAFVSAEEMGRTGGKLLEESCYVRAVFL